MTLAVWFARTLGVRIAAAVLALLAVLQLTDLFETAPRLLDEGRGAGGLGVYALLHAPELLVQAAPVGVLAGALFGFGRLARDNAVTTLRAAGVSAYRMVALAAPAAAVVAAMVLALVGWGAPRSEAALATWMAKGAPPTAPAGSPTVPAPAPLRRSFRLGGDIVSASPGDAGGRRLADVDVSMREGDGRLVRRLIARDAVRRDDGRWRLRDVSWEAYGRADLSPGAVASGHAAEMAWTDRLDPADVRDLWRADASPSPQAAWRGLHGGAAPLPLPAYREQLDRIWAAPVGVLVMLLIAAPAALGQARDGGLTRLMLACLTGGLVFLVADGLCGALGSGGVVPAILAAWITPVLFAAAAAAVLLHLEG